MPKNYVPALINARRNSPMNPRKNIKSLRVCPQKPHHSPFKVSVLPPTSKTQIDTDSESEFGQDIYDPLSALQDSIVESESRRSLSPSPESRTHKLETFSGFYSFSRFKLIKKSRFGNRLMPINPLRKRRN